MDTTSGQDPPTDSLRSTPSLRSRPLQGREIGCRRATLRHYRVVSRNGVQSGPPHPHGATGQEQLDPRWLWMMLFIESVDLYDVGSSLDMEITYTTSRPLCYLGYAGQRGR